MADPKQPQSTHQGLTHVDQDGRVRMVDVSDKQITHRRARASATIEMAPETFDRILGGQLPKGDVLAAARLAGIQAAKRTAELIPLCHPLPLDAVSIEIIPDPPNRLRIEAIATVQAKTGVEMEALTAAGVAALTVYDMCKAVDRGMSIGPIQLEEKSGGRSGHWRRESEG